MSSDGKAETLTKGVRDALKTDSVTPEDIMMAMLLSKASDKADSMRDGLDEIRLAIQSGALSTPEAVEEALNKAVASGKLSKDALNKFLRDTGASSKDLAKSLLIESALGKNGVTKNKMDAALEGAVCTAGEISAAVKLISEALDGDRISMDDIAKAMAMAKAVEGGKIRYASSRKLHNLRYYK